MSARHASRSARFWLSCLLAGAESPAESAFGAFAAFAACAWAAKSTRRRWSRVGLGGLKSKDAQTSEIGCGSKIGGPKWTPGKWRIRLKPAYPWVFMFEDPKAMQQPADDGDAQQGELPSLGIGLRCLCHDSLGFPVQTNQQHIKLSSLSSHVHRNAGNLPKLSEGVSCHDVGLE